MTTENGGVRMRTRVGSCIDLKAWDVRYVVQVNLGAGWAHVVRDGKLVLFDTKQEADSYRAGLRAWHRNRLAEKPTA